MLMLDVSLEQMDINNAASHPTILSFSLSPQPYQACKFILGKLEWFQKLLVHAILRCFPDLCDFICVIFFSEIPICSLILNVTIDMRIKAIKLLKSEKRKIMTKNILQIWCICVGYFKSYVLTSLVRLLVHMLHLAKQIVARQIRKGSLFHFMHLHISDMQL